MCPFIRYWLINCVWLVSLHKRWFDDDPWGFRANHKTPGSSKGSVPLPPALAEFWSGILCSTPLFHRGRAAISRTLCLSPAWRGYVARQNLKQIKKEREEAAMRIQSGMKRFLFPPKFVSCSSASIWAVSHSLVSAGHLHFFKIKNKCLKTSDLCETPFWSQRVAHEIVIIN